MNRKYEIIRTNRIYQFVTAAPRLPLLLVLDVEQKPMKIIGTAIALTLMSAVFLLADENAPSNSPIAMNFQTPEETLQQYEQSLSQQSWGSVEPLIHEDAVFIFTESTFRGKDEVRQAFEKTFDLIKEEKYWITDLSWVARTNEMASCEYIFNWEGIIHGKRSAGGGRGSSVLIKTEDGWKIIQEHLGPPAK